MCDKLAPVVILRETIRRQLTNVTKWKNAEKEAYPNMNKANILREKGVGIGRERESESLFLGPQTTRKPAVQHRR